MVHVRSFKDGKDWVTWVSLLWFNQLFLKASAELWLPGTFPTLPIFLTLTCVTWQNFMNTNKQKGSELHLSIKAGLFFPCCGPDVASEGRALPWKGRHGVSTHPGIHCFPCSQSSIPGAASTSTHPAQDLQVTHSLSDQDHSHICAPQAPFHYPVSFLMSSNDNVEQKY